MTQPFVSFIIPYYNSGSTINRTLDSIEKQTYKNYDIWIVNDGSTDLQSIELLEVIEKKSTVKIIHQKNQGPSIARNAAILNSSADVIIPLDADDTIEPDAITHNIDLLMKNDSVGIVFGNVLINQNGNTSVRIQEKPELRQLFLWNPIANCCLIKKKVFETVGYYDEFLSKPGLEDWELWFRVTRFGWKFVKSDDAMFTVYVNDHSRTFEVANKNLISIKHYIYTKYADLLALEYEKLFYEKKMLAETPDFRIGNMLLRPYRIVKQMFNQ